MTWDLCHEQMVWNSFKFDLLSELGVNTRAHGAALYFPPSFTKPRSFCSGSSPLTLNLISTSDRAQVPTPCLRARGAHDRPSCERISRDCRRRESNFPTPDPRVPS